MKQGINNIAVVWTGRTFYLENWGLGSGSNVTTTKRTIIPVGGNMLYRYDAACTHRECIYCSKKTDYDGDHLCMFSIRQLMNRGVNTDAFVDEKCKLYKRKKKPIKFKSKW
jgi:hypothetical protein